MRVLTQILTVMMLLAFAGAVGCHAEEYSKVCLHLNSGEVIVFRFADRPVMTFDGANSLVVKDATKNITTQAYGTLHKISFKDPSGIDDVVTGAAGEITPLGPTDLSLVGFKPGTPVFVTSVNGVQLFSDTVAGDAPYQLSLGSYGTGMYIVSVGGVTYKISIK